MSDFTKQIEALTAGVGVVRFTPRTHIEILGSDRATFLHNLCTADIQKLAEGQGSEAFFTDVQGKVIGHAAVFCGHESFRLETSAGQAADLMRHIDRYLITEDVRLEDRTDEWEQLIVAGRQSKPLLSKHCGPLTELVDEFRHARGKTAEGWVDIRRMPLIAGNCYFLVATPETVRSVRKALLADGAAGCGVGAVEVLRIENGWPYYAQDITSKNLPQEVCRNEHAISFTKGCYLGQETVARIDALGHVNRHLVGLRCDGEQPPIVGSGIAVDGKQVGAVTSAIWSPRLGAIGMGYVRREHADVGTQLTVGKSRARVVALPM